MGCFIISMSLGGSLSANSLVSNDLNTIPNQWYKSLFRPFFYDKNKLDGDSIILWETKGKETTKDLHDMLKIIPNKVKQRLFSNQTLNPFRAIYSDVYTPKARKAFKKCDFVGIQFKLDDRAETQEWYIAAPVETCLYGEKAIGPIPAGDNSEIHYWILQKDSRNQYQILMESGGLLTVTNIKQQGYKQLKTQIFNQHIYRDKADKDTYPLQSCGGARIIWEFRADKYYPIELYPATAFCDRGYDEMMHNYERGMLLDKQLKEVVRPQVLQWLNSFSKGALTVNWKTFQVIPANPKPSPEKGKSSTTFSADEMEIIDKLLY